MPALWETVMKNEILKTMELQNEQTGLTTWRKTGHLRWFNRRVGVDGTRESVLQQAWENGLGDYAWYDIETVKEP